MKKIKLFLCVALFGAMSFGAFSAYEHYTMSEEERFLLANVEALSSAGEATGTGTGSGEGGGSGGSFFTCYNGGPGSRACSIEGGIEILGSGVSAKCSVDCYDGYYACCGIRCNCRPS